MALTEQEEMKLRTMILHSLEDYFSDNLPAHLYPEQRIKSVSYALTDIIMDTYDAFLTQSKND